MKFENIQLELHAGGEVRSHAWFEDECKVELYGKDFTITITKVYTINNYEKIKKKYGLTR